MDSDTYLNLIKKVKDEIKKNPYCVFCNHKCTSEEFEDMLSLQEFLISHICMDCQNKMFREENE